MPDATMRELTASACGKPRSRPNNIGIRWSGLSCLLDGNALAVLATEAPGYPGQEARDNLWGVHLLDGTTGKIAGTFMPDRRLQWVDDNREPDGAQWCRWQNRLTLVFEDWETIYKYAEYDRYYLRFFDAKTAHEVLRWELRERLK